MVIRPQATGNETYAVRMLSGNNIRGRLSFQDKNLNGEVKYYYDITSKQPLSRILEHRNLSGDELKELVSELLYTLKQLERFFLDEGQLCFLPEYIYVEPASFKASFCLIPGRKTEFAAELCELSQYLLDHVNQSDGEAVVLAFSIFKECRKLNFGMEDIERCLRQQDLQKRENREMESVQSDHEKKKKEITEPNGVKIKSIDDPKPKEEPIVLEVQKTEKTFRCFVPFFLIIYMILMILVPCVLLLIFGFERIRSKLLVIAAGELIAVVLLILILVLLRKRKDVEYDRKPRSKKHQRNEAGRSKMPIWNEYPILKENNEDVLDDSKEEPWEVYFRELNEEEMMPEEWRKDTDDEENDDDFQTVLLSARPIDKEARRLVPVNGGNEIAIGYYPFLIGKGRDLTDYCLNKPGVSRLHVKIEETENGYMVTDLNSTNGTAVNGVLLEANGKAPLMIGDELTIAAERYYFR